ncbi:MAG TPA: hypothetical protein VM597_06135 [Gemmataceae bacterium]|jgi:hypothetical protein|nr:hypothetical protein [Gemmataceae bacterium]
MRLAPVARWSARVAAGLLLAALVVAGPAHAGPPGSSNAYGKSLTEWMTLYMTWALGGDQEGQVGKVMFMPLPAGEPVDPEAAGTLDDPLTLRGEIDVTLKPGTAFAMPVAVWIGEYYEVGEDPYLPDSVFLDSDVLVRMDGKTIIDSDRDDLRKFYVPPTDFDPAIPYAEPTGYGALGATFFQGIGFVHRPLSKGEHTMTLRSEIRVPEYNLWVIFENTWNITVSK